MIAGVAGRLERASEAAAAPRPKVLFLTHTGRIGGAEICLLAVTRALEGTVLLFQDGVLHARLLAAGVDVALPRVRPDLRAIRRDRGLLWAVPLTAGIIGLLGEIRARAERHDLLYCNSQKSFVLGALAARRRTKLLWHLHDILDRRHFGRAQIRLVVTLANRRADRVVAPSRAVARAFVDAGGRPELVRVVANGVAVPGEVACAAARPVLRRALGLPEGFLFGVFSRLAPWKGQHVALEALAMLPDASCIIAGDAQFGEDHHLRALHVQAERLGVAGRVRFLGHREDVALLMQAVDAVVHPSVDPEPFGLTLIEAMLAGTPVVASRAGAAEEILDGGRFGALVPPGDAPALAAALRRCGTDPDAVRREVVVARQHAGSRYSDERLCDEIAGVVLELARR